MRRLAWEQFWSNYFGEIFFFSSSGFSLLVFRLILGKSRFLKLSAFGKHGLSLWTHGLMRGLLAIELGPPMFHVDSC